MDYGIVHKEVFVMIITEAAKEDMDGAVVQNLIQLKSAGM